MLRVVQIGLGPIGIGIAERVVTGVPGDSATAAVAVHCAPLVPSLAPGLRTMLDVPLRPLIRGGS